MSASAPTESLKMRDPWKIPSFISIKIFSDSPMTPISSGLPAKYAYKNTTISTTSYSTPANATAPAVPFIMNA